MDIKKSIKSIKEKYGLNIRGRGKNFMSQE